MASQHSWEVAWERQQWERAAAGSGGLGADSSDDENEPEPTGADAGALFLEYVLDLHFHGKVSAKT
eukprot:15457162-Alexandrium_andersonii.AAC.1